VIVRKYDFLHDGSVVSASGFSGSGINVEVLSVALFRGANKRVFSLRFVDFDNIGLFYGATVAAGGVVREHDLDLDADDTLLEFAVPDSGVNVAVLGRVTRFDHVTVLELDGFGTRTSQLTRDDDLGTFSAILEDVAKDTVAGAAGGEASEESVADRFSLGDGAQGTVLDAFGEEYDVVFGEVESLLNLGFQFSDALALLAKDRLCFGGADDDLRFHGSDAYFDARVTICTKFALEKFVEFGIEDAVLYELSLLRDLGGAHVG